MALEQGKYYLMNFDPYFSKVYWKNRTGIIYVYDLDEKDFVNSGFDEEYFTQDRILKVSDRSDNLIYRQKLSSIVFHIREVWALAMFPIDIIWMKIRVSLGLKNSDDQE